VSAPVLTPKELAVMVRAAVLGGRWGDSPIGEQVDAYLDALEYAESSTNTLLAYEYVLGFLPSSMPI
jgi:hypothetical protein